MTEGDDMPITMSSGSGSGILVNYTIEVSSIICACGIHLMVEYSMWYAVGHYHGNYTHCGRETSQLMSLF